MVGTAEQPEINDLLKILDQNIVIEERCLLEKCDELHVANLYDKKMNVVRFKDKEIKLTRKSYTVRKRDGFNKVRSSFKKPINQE